MTPYINYTFSVNRSIWHRGSYTSCYLYNERSGEYCILGTYLKSLGISPELLDGEGTPLPLEDILPEEASWLLSMESVDGFYSVPCLSDSAQSIICINDDSSIDDSYREYTLKSIFESHGIRVIFISKE